MSDPVDRGNEERWRNYATVLFAGYSCGAGLVMMFAECCTRKLDTE